jgi:hypothetical protein
VRLAATVVVVLLCLHLGEGEISRISVDDPAAAQPILNPSAPTRKDTS